MASLRSSRLALPNCNEHLPYHYALKYECVSTYLLRCPSSLWCCRNSCPHVCDFVSNFMLSCPFPRSPSAQACDFTIECIVCLKWLQNGKNLVHQGVRKFDHCSNVASCGTQNVLHSKNIVHRGPQIAHSWVFCASWNPPPTPSEGHQTAPMHLPKNN